MINRQFLLSCFLLFLSVAGWTEEPAKCAYAESAVRLNVLEVNYCLELHSTNKSGVHVILCGNRALLQSFHNSIVGAPRAVWKML